MGSWQSDAQQAAARYGLGDWFVRQMGLEAHGADLTSPAGAQGPAQFMPGTARSVGLTSSTVHQRVPAYNAAAKLMAGYVKQYGSVKNALVAYNAGPGAVGRSLPAETQNYLKTILPHGGGSVTAPSAPSHQPSMGPSLSLGAASAPTVAPALGDPGQAGDFSSLVSSLLSQKAQPSAPSISALPAPSFAASPSLPQTYQQLQPVGAPTPPAQDRVQTGLSLVGALGGTEATAGSSSSLAGPQTGPSAPTGASAPAAPAKTLKVKPGSPVADLTSEGGLHPTEGLNGFPAHDYFAPSGSAAVAPVTGKVVRLSGHDPKQGPVAGPHGPLGWSVYIQGSDGRTYYLTHMGSRNVRVGQTVRAGQQIGTVANYAKYGTPSHIHMGISG
jgi:murein DD-endopeptidase MepM/ murein hydrolase activator NlpD